MNGKSYRSAIKQPAEKCGVTRNTIGYINARAPTLGDHLEFVKGLKATKATKVDLGFFRTL